MKNKLLIVASVLIIAVACIVIFQKSIDKTLIGNSDNSSPTKLEQNSYSKNPLKIILLIGDGMGINHTQIGRITMGGPDFNMAVDRMPIQGTVINHSYDSLNIDSAASATAWATGTSTINRFVGVDPAQRSVPNISEVLEEHGFLSGLVATSSITHATPAAHYAHVGSRYEEEEIASQLVNSNIHIALGGGKEFFNLDDSKDATFFFDLDKIPGAAFKTGRVIGLFAEDGINRGEGPSQLEMTKVALDYLHQDSPCSKLFLMSEGSQIDWASHDNDLKAMLIELEDFNATVNTVLDYASQRDDVLVVVSSDHETGGLTVLGQKDDFVYSRWNTDKHSLNQIGIYAYGPGAEAFAGKMDQTEIFTKLTSLANKETCTIN
jgi:alkaline phosphatase